MKEKTHYERIVGGTAGEKRAALRTLQELFEGKSPNLARHELAKTPEDEKIITKVILVVDRIVKKYGGEPKPLPLKKIHIFKQGGVAAITEGRLSGGLHRPLGLDIGAEKTKSRLMFAGNLAHELFHLKSYKAAQVGEQEKDVNLYRSGISMVGRKNHVAATDDEKEYFGALEEAIVAECTKKFLEEIKSDPNFRGEAIATAKILHWFEAHLLRAGMPAEAIKLIVDEFQYILDPKKRVKEVLAFSDDENQRAAYAAGMFQRLLHEEQAQSLGRYEERKKMYVLLDSLAANSGGKFKNRDEVFEEFARANFTGNYMPIARIVESILGKGSFRKLANEFAATPSP